MKYYHMIVEKLPPYYNPNANMTHTRTEYINAKQGHAPAGWRCVGVCGYHEEPAKKVKREDIKQ